jgi:hypothetical protein
MFRVDWQPSATDDLAAICLNHQDRWNDIDAAENDIDYRLRKNPIHFSQPVAEGLRRVISEPLAIYFSVSGNQISIAGVGWLD